MKKNAHSVLKSIFNLDSPWLRASAMIYDLIILNLMVVVSSLPLITFGLAKLSLYQALLEKRRSPSSSVFLAYLRALKSNWLQGLQLGALELGLVMVCLGDLWLIHAQEGLFFQAFKIMCYAMLFLIIMTFLYVYPMAALYEMSVSSLLKQSFLVAGLNLHWTFMCLGILAILYIMMSLSPLALMLGLSAIVLVMLSTLAYLHLGLVEPVLANYSSIKED